MAPRFVAYEKRSPMAARVPALRLGTGGAKRSAGRQLLPARTLRKLGASRTGTGQEQIPTPKGGPSGETYLRFGSKRNTCRNSVPGSPVGPRPWGGTETGIRSPCAIASFDEVYNGRLRGPAPPRPIRRKHVLRDPARPERAGPAAEPAQARNASCLYAIRSDYEPRIGDMLMEISARAQGRPLRTRLCQAALGLNADPRQSAVVRAVRTATIGAGAHPRIWPLSQIRRGTERGREHSPKEA